MNGRSSGQQFWQRLYLAHMRNDGAAELENRAEADTRSVMT